MNAQNMMSVFSQLSAFYEEHEILKRENEILKSKVAYLEKQCRPYTPPPSTHSTDDIVIDTEEIIKSVYVEPPSPCKSDMQLDEKEPISKFELEPLPNEDEEKTLFEECVKNGRCICEGDTYSTGKRRGNKPLDLFSFKIHYKKSKHHKLHMEKVNSMKSSSPSKATNGSSSKEILISN